MKILALEKEVPGVSPDQFQPYLKVEAGRVWDLTQQGIFREVYFHTDQHTAVLVLECANTQDAKSVLATLPLVQEGLITFEIIPLAPYKGFSRLFADM